MSLSSVSVQYWNEIEAENLLDGVGLYCSGASLLPLVMHILCMLKETDLFAAEPDTMEAILEHAGNFLSGEPLTSAILGSPTRNTTKKKNIPIILTHHRKRIMVDTTTTTTTRVIRKESEPSFLSESQQALFAGYLPPDIHIYVCTFLHPKDVVNLACVSKACHATVEQQPSSTALWKALFHRDFAWTVMAWDVGCQAMARSLTADYHLQNNLLYTKDFYFRFGLAFVDFVLAGQNTMERCLVGLGGQIYDLTPFLLSHPGSPETVLVSAGKDATQFFANVRHSSAALRLAKSLCVVAHPPHRAAGLVPTPHSVVLFKNPDPGPEPNCYYYHHHHNKNSINHDFWLPQAVEPDIMDTKVERVPETLQRIRQAYLEERLDALQRARKSRHTSVSRLTDINAYYDPFGHAWKAWYTNDLMETVFVDKI